MVDKITKLEPYRVDYLCDDCNKPIKTNGGIRNSMGEKWYHFCPNCKKDYGICFGYDVKYPRIEYKDLDNE